MLHLLCALLFSLLMFFGSVSEFSRELVSCQTPYKMLQNLHAEVFTKALTVEHFQYISKIMPMMSSFVCPITIPMPRPSAPLL